MLAENARIWREKLIAQGEARGEARGEIHGEAEATLQLLRRQIAKRTLTIDQARADVEDMIAHGDIHAEAGRMVLECLG